MTSGTASPDSSPACRCCLLASYEPASLGSSQQTLERCCTYRVKLALLGAGLLAGTILAVVVGVTAVGFASRTIRVRPAVASGNVATAQYASGIGTVGFAMQLVGSERHPQVTSLDVPAGMQLVRVEVSFANTSSGQQRADRQDFSLRDATGATRQPITGGDACPAWAMADLHSASSVGQPPRDAAAQQVGSSFGPMPLCFAVAGNPDGELRLEWDPDVSIAFLSSPVEVLVPASNSTSQ